MSTKNRSVRKIAQLLAKNASFLKENGLNGKLRFSLCLFEYAKLSKKDYYDNLAFDLLDYAINKELLIDIKKATLDFNSGISGIGLFVLFMTQNKYFETDVDQILEIIDKRIYTELEVLTRVEKKENLVTLLSLVFYLKYRRYCNKFSNNDDDFLNEEATLLTEISICHLLNFHKYKFSVLSQVDLLIDELQTIADDLHLVKAKNIISKNLNGCLPSRYESKYWKNKIEYKIFSHFQKQQKKVKAYQLDIKIDVSDIIKEQVSPSEIFRNLAAFGYLIITKENLLTRLFISFTTLDFYQRNEKNEIKP